MLEIIASTRVKDLPLRPPCRVGLASTIGEAVDAMCTMRRGAVIIEDERGQVAGIFTERDLVVRVDHGDAGWRERPITDVMTPDPETFPVTATFAEALRSMSRHSRRHVALVDSDGHVVALASVRDLLSHLAEKVPQEFVNLPPDPRHEARRPWGG